MVAVAQLLNENYGLKGGNSQSRRHKYAIVGTEDVDEAEATLLATAPGLISVGSVDYTLADYDLTWTGPELFEASVDYSTQTQQQEGESSFGFEIVGQTQKITHSKETRNKYPASPTPPDFKGAIGVNSDGEIEGADIYVPAMTYTETHYLGIGAVDLTYVNTLLNLVGKVNDDTYRGFASGELLFLGARGNRRRTTLWEVQYQWAGSPNATGLAVGTITGISKFGWDYLWVYYERVDDAAGVTVKRPKNVYVERVYDPGDFTLLGI